MRKSSSAVTGLDQEPPCAMLTVGTGQSFYRVLLNAIDAAFSSMGESSMHAIYYHLEGTFGIRKREIPFRIDDFSDALEKIFGSGARHLEILIMKKLHEEIQIEYKWDLPKWVVPELTFKQYVNMMKRNFA